MRRTPAAIGSTLFFAAAPGTVAVLVPWLITHWEFQDPLAGWAMVPLRIAGGLLALAGLSFLVRAFVRFVAEGFGTPMPLAPPEKLVVGGVYRYVRNPMYVSILAAIIGQALLFGDPRLLLYFVIVAVPVVSFVRWYEEPHLRRTFGADYEEYVRTVPGWWPRISR
ncbi:methyltransferase family protein [Nonomuraea sediminis]|uniref:methyltransferase family protein n=1 Tax=Nonomuraea sediminis TaxID=2835864 RepID=UPI001BDDC2F8|nr:isoprenylcysteine carboxylmethyltransferase family protein [Nonomuraea sediminis]